jgi:hypothetical protein
VRGLSRQCGILNILQPYRPPWPVTGIALLFYFVGMIPVQGVPPTLYRIKKLKKLPRLKKTVVEPLIIIIRVIIIIMNVKL